MRLGQNFLIDAQTCLRIVKSVEIPNNSPIFEIGPGQGVLTQHLVKIGPVTVCQIDTKLADKLAIKYPQIKILNQDFRKLKNFLGCQFIVASIPFYITKVVFASLIQTHLTWKVTMLVLQKQVVDKIFQNKMNKLKFGLANYFTIIRYADIPARFFSPKPKVDGAVIKLICKPSMFNKQFVQEFRKIFNYCRKKLSNIQTKLVIPDQFKQLRPQDLDFQKIKVIQELTISSRL